METTTTRVEQLTREAAAHIRNAQDGVGARNLTHISTQLAEALRKLELAERSAGVAQ